MTPDEVKMKEIVKGAVAEALSERELRKNPKIHTTPSNATLKTVLLWVLILVIAVGLYNLVEHSTLR